MNREGAEGEAVQGAEEAGALDHAGPGQGAPRELQEHQRDMVLFALATGVRQGNVTGLRWSQMDLARRTAWVHGEHAKNGDDLHVSLNDLAVQVLQRQRGKHPEYVFTD